MISYQFSTGPLSTEDRFVNPLGFQVLSYRRNAESAPTTGDGAVAPATPYVPGATPIVPTTVTPSPTVPPRTQNTRPGAEVQL